LCKHFTYSKINQKNNPSWENAPFDERNKSPRAIFIWLKIEGEVYFDDLQFGASSLIWLYIVRFLTLYVQNTSIYHLRGLQTKNYCLRHMGNIFLQAYISLVMAWATSVRNDFGKKGPFRALKHFFDPPKPKNMAQEEF